MNNNINTTTNNYSLPTLRHFAFDLNDGLDPLLEYPFVDSIDHHYHHH